jgi:hypothetical protein
MLDQALNRLESAGEAALSRAREAEAARLAANRLAAGTAEKDRLRKLEPIRCDACGGLTVPGVRCRGCGELLD